MVFSLALLDFILLFILWRMQIEVVVRVKVCGNIQTYPTDRRRRELGIMVGDHTVDIPKTQKKPGADSVHPALPIAKNMTFGWTDPLSL